jgi:hypothetical protein
MCEFCEKEKTLLSMTNISPCSWGFGQDIKIRIDEISEINNVLFIDRGYLRLSDINDSQCIESGEKIKINFCPICGNKINE